mgnify:CR=1 FL=1
MKCVGRVSIGLVLVTSLLLGGATAGFGQPTGLPVVELPVVPLPEAPQRSRTNAAGNVIIDLGRGPVSVSIPASYQSGTPMPLVLLLHGYGASGAAQEAYMQFAPLSEQYGFLYARPDGSIDPGGNRFWNATDACCNFYGSTIDDSGYLLALIDAVKAQLTVDDRRVYLIGHSNGGFMSYRMACDHPETIAAIASLAGATFQSPIDCSPVAPVHALQIHGTNDTVIRYHGGNLFGALYPGAIGTVEQWAGFDGCDLLPDTSAPPLDLDASIAGSESTVRRYATDCAAGGSTELWTIPGGAHSPNLSAAFNNLVIEYLLAHPKPTAVDADHGDDAEFARRPELSVSPNPFQHTIELQLRLPNAGLVAIDAFNAGGQRVRSVVSAEFGAGLHRFEWDGRGEDGASLAAGLYFLRVASDGRARQTKVIRLN